MLSELLEELSLDNIRKNIVGLDKKVPLLDGSYTTYINLDNAASTPILIPVLNKVTLFLDWYSSVHRGTGFKSQLATKIYDEAHDIVADFVGADKETNTVIFVKNTTEALNKLARSIPFKEGDIVLTSMMEHHSNDLPWRKVAKVIHLPVKCSGELDEEQFDFLLDKYRDQVKLVAITGASNVTGYINPVHRLAEKAHAINALILVDAAQLIAHRKIDMLPDDHPGHLDFLAFSAHKMYAPLGSGALIGRRDFFTGRDPESVGGGTVNFVGLDAVRWADLPDREEPGSPNVVGAVALAEAITCLEALGMDNIMTHESDLVYYLLNNIIGLSKVEIYGSTDPGPSCERVGVIPFSLHGISHYLTAAILSAEGGIGVRNGCFCAHPYLLHLMEIEPRQVDKVRLEIDQGMRVNIPGLVRVSFGCYNEKQEIDKFLEVLKTIISGSWKGAYIQDRNSGEYHPKGFSPNFSEYFSLGQARTLQFQHAESVQTIK